MEDKVVETEEKAKVKIAKEKVVLESQKLHEVPKTIERMEREMNVNFEAQQRNQQAAAQTMLNNATQEAHAFRRQSRLSNTGIQHRRKWPLVSRLRERRDREN